MKASEARVITNEFNQPLESYLNGCIEQIKVEAKIGKYELFYNTSKPIIEYLKELINRYEYRVFIREPLLNCNGYPLWCIYWGEEREPKFNVGSDKMIELLVTI